MTLFRNLSLAALTAVCGAVALATISAHQAKSAPAPAPMPATAVSAAAQPGARLTLERPMAAAGGRQIRSLLDVNGPMAFGAYVWDDRGVPEGDVWVHVDLAAQLISVFRGGDEIGTAVILYGADSKETPVGEFPVLQKAADYRSKTYDAEMPYMLKLTPDGVAIHASNVREGYATHGCVGVPLAFARLLYGQVKAGDRVVITAG